MFAPSKKSRLFVQSRLVNGNQGSVIIDYCTVSQYSKIQHSRPLEPYHCLPANTSWHWYLRHLIGRLGFHSVGQ